MHESASLLMEERIHCSEIVLVRHGETSWNASRRLQGQQDIPLNDAGREQLRSLGVTLKPILNETPGAFSSDKKIAAIYSSDLKRAAESATLLAESLDFPLDKIVYDNRLREWHAGHMEGCYLSDVPQQFPESWAAWRRRDCYYVGHGGESLYDKFIRAKEALEEIGRKHEEERVLVVTHSLVIDDAIRMATGVPLDKPTRMPKKNAGVYMLHFEWREGGGPPLWRLLRAGDKILPDICAENDAAESVVI